MRKEILPLAAMEKLIKKAGAIRVSEDAKEALREYLEEKGQEISSKAIVLAEHSKRRTVKREDIRLATR